MPPKSHARNVPGSVRIIAGQCRGRRLSFPSVTGLRPTSDRLREALFSWLHSELPGTRCLDLFAGSGALGLEAISRGANHATLLEVNNLAVAALRENVAALDLDHRVNVIKIDALLWLGQYRGTEAGYDIVFIDPPFASALASEAVDQLFATSGLLTERALIYVELPSQELPTLQLPGFTEHRRKTVGESTALLFRRTDVGEQAD